MHGTKTVRLVALTALVVACGSPSARSAASTDGTGTTSALELGALRGAPNDSAACWSVRDVRPHKSADSAMVLRPGPHADSVMAVRPVCPPAG